MTMDMKVDMDGYYTDATCPKSCAVQSDDVCPDGPTCTDPACMAERERRKVTA